MSDQENEKVSGEAAEKADIVLEEIDWLNLSPEQTIMVLDKAAEVFGDLAMDAFKCCMILQDRSKRAADWSLGLKTMVVGQYPQSELPEEGDADGESGDSDEGESPAG